MAPRMRHQAGDGVEQRGLAGAVQADDGDELALAHVQRHVLQRLRLAVEDADVVDIQQRRRGRWPLAAGRSAISISPPR